MRFEYLEPTTINEAVSLLNQYGNKARVIAGGTDLLVQIRNKTIQPEYVIDIERITGLDYIKYDAHQGLRIGALTTIRTLERSTELHQRYPVISQAASQLGSVAIRNVATLGGNICNAVPSADLVPALIGLSSRAKIIGPAGEREAPLEDFFTGPGSTILRTGELLIEIQVPIPLPNTTGVYLKYGIRGTIDLAIVGVATIVTSVPETKVCRDIKIVLGAVAPTPIRARNAEDIIRGKKIEESLIEKVAQAASDEAHPISDVRASAKYRKEIVKVLTLRAIKESGAL